jgi:arabinan endo-1,5-alpha-L-arabinosidase
VKRLALVLSALLVAACGAVRGPGAAMGGSGETLGALGNATGSYQNPVLDQDFPDPMVLATTGGQFYAYATGTAEGGVTRHISVSHSNDLIHWENAHEALPAKPGWAHTKNNFWAPHVIELGGRYVMYYSVEPDWSKSEHLRLAIATSASPAGPFVDVGAPMETGDAEENLDPDVFTDPANGKLCMYWGRNGVITSQALAPDGMSFAAGSQPQAVLKANPRSPYEKIVEGPFVTFRDGFYYLFYSGDDCCVHAHYATMVARARTPQGPFEKLATATHRPDSAILRGNDHWRGPGHNAVLSVGQQDWLIYHAVDANHPVIAQTKDTRRPLLIDPISYQDGWPVVGNGTPSIGAQAAPLNRLHAGKVTR